MSSSIVLIGPPEALDALKARVEAGADLQTFTDAEALEALDHIIRTQPQVVALEKEFAAASRGTALINRIKDDPSLAGCEVRVVAPDSNVVAVPRGGAAPAAAAVEEPKPALDQRGTRRAPRIRMRDGIAVTVDGNPSALVDLSAVGAQVVSVSVLRPNQRVRVILGDGKTAVRCNAAIAWASFEMPKGQPPRYRAGIEFLSADPDAVAGFANRHKKE